MKKQRRHGRTCKCWDCSDTPVMGAVSKHLERHPKYKGLTATDIMIVLERQAGKCLITGKKLTFRDLKQQSAMVIRKNDELEGFTPDNVRLVSIYANRYVIDPGDGRTLDVIAAEKKGLEQ